MKDTQKELINELIKEKPHLISKRLYNRSYKFIIEVLELPEWNDPKFQILLTSTIWLSNLDTIKGVLKMPQWKEPKFQGLLTPNIWHNNIATIKSILELPEWNDPKFTNLLSSTMWHKDFKTIKAILKLPEWNDPNYCDLLTPTLWCSNIENIQNKLHLPYWKNPKYRHLLAPSIFTISTENIENGIQLLEQYHISEYITFSCLRYKTDALKLLIEYLIANEMPLVVEDSKTGIKKLNPILNASKQHLKTKYGIDITKISENQAKLLIKK